MNCFDVRFQRVDSPKDQSEPAGSVEANALVAEFRRFPFAAEVKRAEMLQGDVTFPTLIFRRQSDGEEIAIWTANATWFDLCLVHDSSKRFLSHQSKTAVEAVLRRFQAESVLDIQPPRLVMDDREAEPVRPGSESVVIYDSRRRWVAAVNLAFVVGGLYVAVRFVPGFGKYFMVGFLFLFSLFWIKDFLFGFKVRLVSDGQSLTWQEGNQTDTLRITEITKMLVGYGRPTTPHSISETWVQFQMANGDAKTLPPNLANGLRARNWRRLKELVAHVRTITPVVVEPFDDPNSNVQGWTEESKPAGKA